MPLGLLAKKLGQTRVYDAKGVITPVTIVLAGPNRVLQCKTQQSDGYNSVQLGFDDQKEQRDEERRDRGLQQRLLHPASVERKRAPGVKPAAGRRVDRARYIPAQNDALAFRRRVRVL